MNPKFSDVGTERCQGTYAFKYTCTDILNVKLGKYMPNVFETFLGMLN